MPVLATIAMYDEIYALREELLRNAEKVPRDENSLRQIIELITFQSKTIASQAAEIKDFRNELVALKSEVNEQAKKIETLENLQASYVQTTRYQAGENQNLHEIQAKKMDKADQGKLAGSVKDMSKRIVLHSDVDILHLVTAHSADIKNLQNNMTKIIGEVQTVRTEVATMKNGLAKKASGTTYVRWGRKTCPSVNGTELVYTGFTGGSYYSSSGAASNYLCLSSDPLWAQYNDGHNAGALIYGTEYELYGPAGSNTAKFTGTNVYQEDAPCSVCRSSRPTVIMIPGRNQCYPGWTMEYKGYLVADAYSHSGATEYVCLDERPEVLQNGHRDTDGRLFYFVEGRAGALPCPPLCRWSRADMRCMYKIMRDLC